MKEGRRAFKVLTGSPTGRRPLGKPRRRWEDNIRMDLKETSIDTRNWVDSLQDECGIEPPGSINHGVSYLRSRHLINTHLTFIREVDYRVLWFNVQLITCHLLNKMTPMNHICV